MELGNGKVITAKALGISEVGELLLDDGSAISIGDITHLR
ncbi:unannotated protein [freshwater metagenome]|uniref:Unannotated protein n=1 Tax=freshwater metagenome TaxID=449393 RepID=A0A6J7M1Q9_9ZZZZ